MQQNAKPKYTALYKKCDFTKRMNKSRVEKIVGSNKQKIHQELTAITMQGISYVWAIFDNNGVCIEGGTTSKKKGNSLLWDERHLNAIAQRFFDTSNLFNQQPS